MFIISGNTIEELEKDFELMKKALAGAKPNKAYVGGSSLEDVENGLRMAKAILEPEVEEEEEIPEEPEVKEFIEKMTDFLNLISKK